MLSELKKYFNHKDFKSDIQKNAIKSVLSGSKNVYISMPTGSGKSLVYQLPGVMQDNKVTFVISPLIALIKNQIDYLLSKKIPARTINSTITSSERDNILGDLKAKKTDTKFLYITPEQAATHTFKELFKLMFKFQKVGFVAVDESHCLSSWGHDFRKDYLKLGDWRREYPSVQFIALTATAPLLVRKDILENLNFKNPKIFQVPCFRKNLYYDIVYKNSLKDDFIELKDFIKKRIDKYDSDAKPSEKPCAIVYCRKKETTESVAIGLRKQGLSCKAFHSGLKKKEKEEVQDDWMNGKVAVIVATVAFGMGIDHQHVRLVVHWDLSQNIASYYQESGRAGRDGKKSYCRLYYDRDEVRSITFLLNQELNKINDIKSDKYLRAKNAIKEFQKITDHCESVSCRHLLFTNYFGDPPPKCDSMCDVCKDKKGCSKRLDAFLQLSAQASLGAKFQSAAEAADVSDLYEGGKVSSKKAYDDYNTSDDNSYGESFRKASEREKKQERSFIDKQFALRKMNAAAAMQMTETTSISRVKSARATETKVAGLTTTTRETNLSLIISTLKLNMEKSALNDPPEVPNYALVHKDLEDIGVEIEFKCFDACKAVSIYRRNIAKEVYAIKISKNLHPIIKNHIPAKHKSYGGDYKTIVSDLKQRFGSDVVDELEKEMQSNTESKKAKQMVPKKDNDGKSQSKISSFFVKKEVKVEHEDYNEETDVSKLELVKLALEKELEEIRPKQESAEEQEDQQELCDFSVFSDFDVSLPFEVKQENDRKRKADTDVMSKPSKVPCMDNAFKKASDILKENDKEKSSKSSTKNSSTASSSSTTSVHDKVHRHQSKNKKKITDIVVKILNQFYHDKKIGGNDPRGLFKKIARKVSHYFYDKDPDKVDKKEISDYIFERFYNHEIITSEADFDTDL